MGVSLVIGSGGCHLYRSNGPKAQNTKSRGSVHESAWASIWRSFLGSVWGSAGGPFKGSATWPRSWGPTAPKCHVEKFQISLLDRCGDNWNSSTCGVIVKFSPWHMWKNRKYPSLSTNYITWTLLLWYQIVCSTQLDKRQGWWKVRERKKNHRRRRIIKAKDSCWGQTLPRTVQNVGATATGWETMHCAWQGKRIIRQKLDRLH